MLPDDRIEAVQTGCCPHTAIRDDITANLDAVELLESRHPGLELVLVESGGDNLTASFSYGLVDVQVFVIDVAGGDKVPRKGGPGVTAADLLVVNKTDLAPMVGADLDVMRRDSAAVRNGKPTHLISLREDPSATSVAEWVREQVRARARAADVRTVVEVVARPGPGGRTVLPVLRASGQFAVRRTGPSTVHLVATAFGPLGGDDAEISLVVEEGATLSVRSVAAAVALPSRGGGRASAQRIRATVDGRLALQLEPTVVTARAHHWPS